MLDGYRHARGFQAEGAPRPHGPRARVGYLGALNVAEGCGRTHGTEPAHFLGIAAESTSETEYQLPLAHDLGYLADPDHRALDVQANEV